MINEWLARSLAALLTVCFAMLVNNGALSVNNAVGQDVLFVV